MSSTAIERLLALLEQVGPLRLACSGGVDSLTLALLAHRQLGPQALICHAVSPAVPQEATERVRQLAALEGWNLRLLNAGEFTDPAYLDNPYDRCFHCKSHLYSALARIDAEAGDATLISGTNCDDLDDYRPGLIAAQAFAVRHPYVECGIDKAGVRAIAAELGHAELSQLPASPCLSSRIETGLSIRAEQLALVQRVEHQLRQALQPEVVRCRIQADGIAIQLDAACLDRLNGAQGHWQQQVQAWVGEQGLAESVRFEPYRMGSAFVARP